MHLRSTPTALPATLAAALFLAGCVSLGGTKSDSGAAAPAPAPAPAAAPTSTTKPAPATAAAPAPAAPSKIGPGMNAAGEVTDPKKVEAGYGQKVKGLNDYEGEITGKPAPGSKFSQLKIGMPMKQVMDIVGQPTDQGAYVTGKAFIPFFFGGDRYRHELVYKGQGRLIFAGSAGFDTSASLIWIIHSAAEQGYRN
jgi:hypothetical protein